MRVKVVTVIGATGTMGANVAGIFASFGDAKVYAVGRDIEKVKNTVPKIIKSVKSNSIAENIIPADFSMLDDCISKSDLVSESLVENMDIKIDIASRVAQVLKPDAISCTGTSGLSVTSLAEHYPENLRKNFFGVHMFNPPYNLPLCEIIPTKYSDAALTNELSEYLRTVLFRTVVKVKDSPAFLGNRIGFQFINEAMQDAEKYKDNGGIDYIDAILGPFTGRSMPPLITADFVGLDIHKEIVDNIYQNTNDFAHDTFLLPHFLQNLIYEKKLGRKTDGGLYKSIKHMNGLKQHLVFDLNTGEYREKIPYVFPFVKEMKNYISSGDYLNAFEILITNHSQEADICLSFILKYLVYSLYTVREIGFTIDAADDVMATGFSWCPPLALFELLSSVADVEMLVKERINAIYEKVDVRGLLSNVKPSNYDYRTFLKSTE